MDASTSSRRDSVNFVKLGQANARRRILVELDTLDYSVSIGLEARMANATISDAERKQFHVLDDKKVYYGCDKPRKGACQDLTAVEFHRTVNCGHIRVMCQRLPRRKAGNGEVKHVAERATAQELFDAVVNPGNLDDRSDMMFQYHDKDGVMQVCILDPVLACEVMFDPVHIAAAARGHVLDGLNMLADGEDGPGLQLQPQVKDIYWGPNYNEGSLFTMGLFAISKDYHGNEDLIKRFHKDYLESFFQGVEENGGVPLGVNYQGIELPNPSLKVAHAIWNAHKDVSVEGSLPVMDWVKLGEPPASDPVKAKRPKRTHGDVNAGAELSHLVQHSRPAPKPRSAQLAAEALRAVRLAEAKEKYVPSIVSKIELVLKKYGKASAAAMPLVLELVASLNNKKVAKKYLDLRPDLIEMVAKQLSDQHAGFKTAWLTEGPAYINKACQSETDNDDGNDDDEHDDTVSQRAGSEKSTKLAASKKPGKPASSDKS